MSASRLPSREEHAVEVARGALQDSAMLGRPTVGTRGTEAVLLRIEALLEQLLERVEAGGDPEPVRQMVDAAQDAMTLPVDIDALDVRELRALCDEYGLTKPDRRSKRKMREALKAHGVG